MSISKYKMPILRFVSIPPNTLDKILEVFPTLKEPSNLKCSQGREVCFMYKDKNLKVLYMEKNNR
jgi:hypothetical protein